MQKTDLPPETDIEHVHKVLSSATDRLLGDLSAMTTLARGTHPATGTFVDETAAIRYYEDIVPRVVQAYLADLNGHCEVLEQLAGAVRSNAGRAAQLPGADPEAMTWCALRARRTILHLLSDELGELDPDVHEAVHRGLLSVSDRVMASALTGFFSALPGRDRTGQSEHQDLCPTGREHMRGILHDLRSPLALISVWADTLVESSDRIDAATSQKALGAIQKATRQVMSLSENLIEIDLVDAGEHRFTPSTFAVAGHVQGLFGDRCGVTVRFDGCDVPSHDDVLAYCDPSALDRALSNLVDNAMQHGMPPIEISVTGFDDVVHVDVTDTGQADPAHITSAFRGRVTSATGFGIGLRTTRLLVEAVGGRLRLISPDPTTFRIELPRDSFGRG